jgi:hypothetical protein
LQPGLFYLRIQMSMREEFNTLIKSYATRPDSYRDVPAAETESIELAADALVPCFLLPPRLYYRDPKLTTVTRTWYRLDKLS